MTTPVKLRAQCQYYELSPRDDMESTASGGHCYTPNENSDLNIWHGQALSSGSGTGPAPEKLVDKLDMSPPVQCRMAAMEGALSNASKQRQGCFVPPPSYQQQPCLRPATPPKPARSTTPPPPNRTSCSLPMTPETRAAHEFDEGPPDFANISVMSTDSHMSRISRLSRKSVTKRQMSTEEIELHEMREKQRLLRERMRKNEITCRKVLNADRFAVPGRVYSSAKITVPQEFCLSAPPTPRAGFRDLDMSVGSVDEDTISHETSWDRSLRRSSCASLSTARGTTSSTNRQPAGNRCTKPWQPQLTVPKGPELNTLRRSSSGRVLRTLEMEPSNPPASSHSAPVSQGKQPKISARGAANPPTRLTGRCGGSTVGVHGSKPASSAAAPCASDAKERAQLARQQRQESRQQELRERHAKNYSNAAAQGGSLLRQPLQERMPQIAERDDAMDAQAPEKAIAHLTRISSVPRVIPPSDWEGPRSSSLERADIKGGSIDIGSLARRSNVGSSAGATQPPSARSNGGRPMSARGAGERPLSARRGERPLSARSAGGARPMSVRGAAERQGSSKGGTERTSVVTVGSGTSGRGSHASNNASFTSPGLPRRSSFGSSTSRPCCTRPASAR